MVGGSLWIVNATPLLERMPFLAREWNDGLYYWGILAILILSALVVLALRARGAKADESRRAGAVRQRNRSWGSTDFSRHRD